MDFDKTTKELFIIIATVVTFAAGAYFLVDIEFMSSFANLVSVFEGLSWFIALFLAATLFTAYLVVVAKINFFIRFLAIPLWLVFTLSTLVTIDKFLGYAYPIVPPKSQLIQYRIFLEDQTKMIESWMFIDGTTRLYKYEWTEEREKELQRGEKGNAEGRPVEIELDGGVAIDLPIGKQQGDYIDHKIKHRGLPPKEIIEREN